MEQGYHILLEKPITQEPVTSVEIGDMAASYDKVFMLCCSSLHSLFAEIKRVLDEGTIGELKTIVHCEYGDRTFFP